MATEKSTANARVSLMVDTSGPEATAGSTPAMSRTIGITVPSRLVADMPIADAGPRANPINRLR